MDYISSLQPLSVQEIAKQAVDFEYNPLIQLRYWLRTADTILKEANIYEREGNDQQAYLLLLRHAELLLKYLPDHPQARLPENVRHVRAMKQQINEDLKRLEVLRPRIHDRWLAYQQTLKEKEARRQLLELSRASDISPAPAPGRYYSHSRSSSSSQQLQSRISVDGYDSMKAQQQPPKEWVDASANPELAVEVARMEFARREREKAARRDRDRDRDRQNSPREVKGQPPIAKYRPVIKYGAEEGSGGYKYLAYSGGDKEKEREREKERDRRSDGFDLQKQMQALNLQLHGNYLDQDSSRSRNRDRGSGGGGADGGGGRGAVTEGRSWIYDYPNIPKRSSAPPPAPLPQYPPSLSSKSSPQSVSDTRIPPPIPPLPDFSARNTASLPPPIVPKKTPLPPPSPPPIYNPTSTTTSSMPSLPSLPMTLTNPTPPPPPKVPASLADPTPPPSSGSTSLKRANTYEFKTSARLENGQRLRTIFLPASLRLRFLELAQPNTARNLETCGVLCGTLIQNALFITRLVIPEQVVTSDTCDMKDEEELFKYVDGEDLMVLGWIHTHPTYECFMSSVDLHNHCGYQLMLPESIAVVCAPKYEPSWGVFRLTDPPGVKTIMTCTQKALFHPHPGGGALYTDAMRPGHVVVVKEMGFEVIDLRK